MKNLYELEISFVKNYKLNYFGAKYNYRFNSIIYLEN